MRYARTAVCPDRVVNLPKISGIGVRQKALEEVFSCGRKRCQFTARIVRPFQHRWIPLEAAEECLEELVHRPIRLSNDQSFISYFDKIANDGLVNIVTEQSVKLGNAVE